MKKYILSMFMCLQIATPLAYAENPSRPSVEQVFGGLTEDQIAEQVKEGQRFLEELEKNGTPEEKAEFERLLMETLESMSEQDFNDITNIAKMVEPHLDLPQEEPKRSPIEETKPETKPTRIVASGSDLEVFQNFIGSITECIDQLLQKMQSSKECSEFVDTKWKSKVTFGSMKRQIYQLRTKRLAEKLSKKELSPEEQDLIKTLKEFLADITEQNDNFKIEDNFGLPTTIELEKTYLKKTQAILSVFDNYIDQLMPMLEKFLRKWDPEALEMQKEADEKSKVALKSATDAETLIAQKPATPSEARRASSTGGNYNSGSQGGYAGSYDPYSQYDQSGYGPGSYGQEQSDFGGKSGSAQKEGAKPTAPKTPEDKATEKSTMSAYDYAASELEEHTKDLFDSKYEQEFVDFLNKVVTNYPPASQTETTPPTTSIRNEIDQTNWIENDFKNYTSKVKTEFKNKFVPSFEHLDDVLGTVKKKIVEMSTDDLQKLQNNKDIATIQRRIARYKEAFDPIQDQLNAKKTQNTSSQQSAATSNNAIFQQKGPEYSKAHNDFLSFLSDKIGDRLTSFQSDLEVLKRKAKRTAGTLRSSSDKKQKQAKVTTQVATTPTVG
jgi:hypothetical protein